MQSKRIEIIVLPKTPADRVAAALERLEWDAPSVVALVVKGERPHVTALRFFDEDGMRLPIDTERVGRHLSEGGRNVGVALLDPAASERGWESWRSGERLEVLSPRDSLWVPRDEDGHPDLDAEPEAFGGAPPEGWRRVRSCLDLGMERLFSCRFTPVGRLFEKMRAGEAVTATAYVLVSDGRALHPPREIGWQTLFRS